MKIVGNSFNLHSSILSQQKPRRMGIAHQRRLSIWWAAPTPDRVGTGSTIDFQPVGWALPIKSGSRDGGRCPPYN
ncbi:hypothetical protein FJZ31_22385 [Candidatus Poribacteria bacterium]|nr:hypothetical protein [Candidatus Poribacteria bacterium]